MSSERARPVSAAQLDTYVYTCPSGFRFTARVAGHQAWIVLPDTVVELWQVRAASGAPYERGGFTYQAKDYEALLETPAGTFGPCRTSPIEPAWKQARVGEPAPAP